MSDEINKKHILEAAIFAAGEPVTVNRLMQLFDEADCPDTATMKVLLEELAADYADRAVDLVQVASGYRFQAKQDYAPWLQRFWEKKPPRYSRALLETIALIAYRQPITRGEIEDVRGVAVSSNIIKILMEREWVKIVGHKEVPGKPALFATTKEFLDYFNLKKLSDLPALQDIMDLEKVEQQLGEQLSLAVDPSEAAQSPETNDDVVTTDEQAEAVLNPETITEVEAITPEPEVLNEVELESEVEPA